MIVKRIFLVALACLFAVMAACGGSVSFGPGEATGTAQPITVAKTAITGSGCPKHVRFSPT